MDGSVKFGRDFHQPNCPIHCPHLCALGCNRIMLILYFSRQFAFLTWEYFADMSKSLEQRHVSGVFANLNNIVKLRQGSGKDGQGMALKAKGLKASTFA